MRQRWNDSSSAKFSCVNRLDDEDGGDDDPEREGILRVEEEVVADRAAPTSANAEFNPVSSPQVLIMIFLPFAKSLTKPVKHPTTF